MIFIDERIVFDFSDVTTTYDSGVYRYDVRIDDITIFVGNIFVESNNKPVIDISDLLKNFYDTHIVYSSTPTKSNIIREVSVSVYNKVQTDEETITNKVCFIYRQPNYNSKVTTPLFNGESNTIKTYPMLQGWDYSINKGLFLPTYPKKCSDILKFDTVLWKGIQPINNVYRTIYTEGNVDESFNVLIPDGEGVYEYSFSLCELMGGYANGETNYEPCEATGIEMLIFSPINPAQRYIYKIANLDSKSRYFLKWRDRYGMSQIQPFKGTHTYSEELTKSSITNYKNIKKLTDVSINSTWKLNTDWISDILYPFYESIFVSPWLQLYDSKEDKLYDVILTNSEYTEKTFKNQNNSLFNLQLDVELDSKQTIIY